MLVLSKRHWFVGTLIALLVYTSVAIAMLWRKPVPAQAADAGEGGIVIGLGPAGGSPAQVRAAEDMEEVKEQDAIPEPEPQPAEKPVQKVKPKAKPKPKPQPKAKPKPPTPVAKVNEQKAPDRKASPSEEQSQTQGVSGNKNQQKSGSGDATPGGGKPGQRADYMASIQAWLERHKEYPRRARRRRQEGTALLYFVINRQGNVLKHELRQSSGYKLLDREVLKMLKRANPLPAMPASMPQATLELVVPLQFKLH